MSSPLPKWTVVIIMYQERSVAAPSPTVSSTSRWLPGLVEPADVVELRALPSGNGPPVGGFYDSVHSGALFTKATELSGSGRYKGVYVTLNPIKPELLARCPNQTSALKGRQAATDADVLCRRWLLIDLDPVRPAQVSATNTEKAEALKRMRDVRAFLDQQGWPAPLEADSGNGYHLIYRIDLPADDGGLVRRVLHGLAERFDDGTVKVDRSVFNPARLVRLYGTVAAKGEHTPERPHRASAVLSAPDTFTSVPVELLECVAATAAQDKNLSNGAVSPELPNRNERVRRARTYLAKLPPAIEGQGGDRQTYAAACVLVRDFALDVNAALPLLMEYNTRCVPPWSEAELVRKLELTASEPGERGRLFRSPEPNAEPAPEALSRVSNAPAPSRASAPHGAVPRDEAGPTFPIVVPDFINWDSKAVVPTPPLDTKDQRGRKKRPPFVPPSMSLAFAWLGLVTQRRNPVTVPLPVVGAALWGGDHSLWPKNWVRVLLHQDAVVHAPGLTKQEKARRTREARAAGTAHIMTCPSDCPLHGTPRHAHKTWTLTKSLGRISQLQHSKNPDGSTRFDLTNKYTKDEAKKVQKKIGDEIANRQGFLRVLRAEGDDRVEQAERGLSAIKRQFKQVREGGRKVVGLRPIYVPAWVFATSPRVGLTPAQQNLLIALTLELTRDVKTKASPNTKKPALGTCPLLDAGTAYVGFNGNGTGERTRLRGHGYKTATWLKKAAYPTGAAVGDLVRDLAALADLFGLVVTAYCPTDGAWLDLAELKAETRTAAGRKRLAGCLVRLYTAADYLGRWRALFAQKLGFARIPENPDELPGAGPVVLQESPVAIKTARELAAWMRKEGLTDAQLAERLEVSRPCIAQYRTGARTMGKAFLSRLSCYTSHSEAGGCNVAVTPSGTGVTVRSPCVDRPVRESATILRS